MLIDFTKKLANGDTNGKEIAAALGDGLKEEFLAPFARIEQFGKKAANGTVTYAESKQFGRDLVKAVEAVGTAVTIGGAAAAKLTKAVPGLVEKVKGFGEESLERIKEKVQGTGYFKVDPSMQAADEAAGVLKNGSYIKNPTAKNLNDLITDSGKIGSKQMSGQYMYVVDTNGNIIIGTRAGQKMPHPTLIGGKDPRVKGAGIIDIRGGQIYRVDNSSGHYKPSAESLQAAEEAFGKLPSSAFSSSFQGYVPYNK